MGTDHNPALTGASMQEPDPGTHSGSGALVTAIVDAPINILIVDDEPKNLTVLETVLDVPGYRLVRAESADQALLALVAEEFALLILDIRMPVMTGFELAQTIKGRKKTARVPIIFLTAYYNEDQHVLEGYGSGAVDYLHKPVNPAVLRSKVAVFAELHRKGRELANTNRTLLAEVTERRRAEEQLRELNEVLDRRVTERTHALAASEARYRSLFHSIDEGFCVIEMLFDHGGRATDFIFLECNLAFEKHSGLVVETGARARSLLPDLEEAWLELLGSVAVSGESMERIGEIKTLKRFVELHAFRIGEQDLSRVAILFRDITDRKRAEENLRERERFLSTVTAAARLGLAVVEPDGSYRFANDAYGQMIGLPPDAIVGRLMREVPADLWEVTHPHLDKAFAGERASFEFTLPPVLGNSRVRHFGAFLEPHLDQKGLRTVAVVMIEITELKQLEFDLRDTDRRKDEFLATLAHELRNPLAPIRNAVQILRLRGPGNGELQWAHEMIERQVQVMARLIDDLMDVSRINQGRIELRREPVALSKVLDWAIEASRPQIDEYGHELALSLPDDPILLGADLTRLSQVFMNLLTNAAKYTDRRGRIELSARLDGDEVVVTVKDNGIGLAIDKLASVFIMFSQVEDALSRSRGGLGIGLSLAKRLVEMHGGRIEAHSAGLGAGSEFMVWLPVLRQAPQGPRIDAGPTSTDDTTRDPVVAAAALRILVVDDNRDGAESLSELVSWHGHEVRTVFDGEAGIQAAAEFRPHVVLLDIGMPGMNGYEVCRRIRQQPWGQKMRLVALTGWGDEEAQREGREAGFDRHLTKPVDETLLMATLADGRSLSRP